MTKDPTCSAESLSTSADVKQDNFSGQLREVPPANRSSLSSYKRLNMTLKHSGDVSYGEKNCLIPGKRNIATSKQVVDLTRNDSQDEKLMDEFIAPCSSKKLKLVKTENSPSQQSRTSHEPQLSVKKASISDPFAVTDLVKQERLQMFENKKDAHNSLTMSPDDGMTATRVPHLNSQKNKGPLSNPASCGDEEKRGSTFLNQVKYFAF